MEEGSSFTVLAKNAVKIAELQVATQLLEMGIGARTHFNARDILIQVGSTLLATQVRGGLKGLGLNTDTLTGKAIANTLSSTATAVAGGLATHTPSSIQQIAANAVAGTVGDETAARLSHEARFIAETESVTHMKLNDPILPLPGKGYGSTSYAMGEMNRARMQQRESRHFTPQHAAKVDAQSARANSFLGAHAESSNKSFVGMLGDEFMKDVNKVTQRTVQKGKEFIHDPVAFMKSAETESLLSPLKSALGLGMWVAKENRHNSAVEAYTKFRDGDWWGVGEGVDFCKKYVRSWLR